MESTAPRTVEERAKEKAEEIRQERIPEAVASVSYNLLTPKGFPIIFTMRGTSESSLFDRMEGVEEFLVDAGYQPDIRKPAFGGGKQEKPKEYAEGRACPTCGSRLIQKTTKTGKVFFECEKRQTKFNPATGKYDPVPGACTFIEWQDGVATTTTAPRSDGPSPKQEQILKEKGLWEEGMSKAEATRLLGTILGK